MHQTHRSGERTHLSSICLSVLVVKADSLSGITTLTVCPQNTDSRPRGQLPPCFKAAFRVSCVDADSFVYVSQHSSGYEIHA